MIRTLWQLYFVTLIPICGGLVMWLLHDGGLSVLHRVCAITPRRDIAYGLAVSVTFLVTLCAAFLTTLICFTIGRRPAMVALLISLLFLGAFILPDLQHRRLLELWACSAVGNLVSFFLSRSVYKHLSAL